MEQQTTHSAEQCATTPWVSCVFRNGKVSLVLILLAAFLFAQTIYTLKEYGYVGTSAYPSKTISVSGSGEVFTKPDTAEFTFSVIEEGDTVASVTDAAAKRTNAALAALKEKGVEEKDVQTIAYTLAPRYEWQPPFCSGYGPCDRKQIQKGFTLTQSVQVKVRDIAKSGEVIDAVSGAGVKEVGTLAFTVADEDAVRADARAQAIEKARTKAQAIAEKLGVSLLRVVSFNEDLYYPMYEEGRGGGDMAVALDGMNAAKVTPTVPTGENRITSNVTVTYEIR